jgi:hypothetical protein
MTKKGMSNDVRVTDVSYGQLSFPSLGDRSSARQIALEVESGGFTPTVYVDAVLVQRGRAMGILVFADLLSPFDEQQKEELAQAVSQRMGT